jgi:hypothetical protein
MIVYNFTMHEATQEQASQGVINLHGSDLVKLKAHLLFQPTYTNQDLLDAMLGLGEMMKARDPDLSGEVSFMVGGLPNLMCALTQLAPIYQLVFADSERKSVDHHMPDGTVKKVAVFKHLGFRPMFIPTLP